MFQALREESDNTKGICLPGTEITIAFTDTERLKIYIAVVRRQNI
jgi:hypothetical protein